MFYFCQILGHRYRWKETEDWWEPHAVAGSLQDV